VTDAATATLGRSVGGAEPPRDPVVLIQGLSKRFAVRRGIRETLLRPRGRRWAQVLDGVTCDVRQGEFVGLLGPNGAGKTTLLKILSTLVLPDAGRAVVAGWDVARDGARVRAVVAPCLASERSLYWRLSATENLQLAADLAGVPRGEVRARIAESLGAVGLADTGAKMVGQFSSGMMQRLLIARALLTRPRLLMLDEPTRSLDPISAREFRRFLRDELVDRRGCAVLLATHNAEEAFDLCDRVAVMNRGRLLAQGPAHDLAERFLGARYRLVTSMPRHPAVAEAEQRGTFVRLGAPADEGEGWYAVTLRLCAGAGAAPAVLQELVTRGVPVARFERVPLSLADLIESVLSSHAGEAA
jgi:ABC-2 type transport system ATP-binding protein